MTTFVVKRPTRFARIFQVIRELCSSPLGTFSFVIVLLFFAVGITADYITPYDPIKIDIRNKLSGPSWDHWLGTDQLGRDVFSRLIVVQYAKSDLMRSSDLEIHKILRDHAVPAIDLG